MQFMTSALATGQLEPYSGEPADFHKKTGNRNAVPCFNLYLTENSDRWKAE